MWDESGFNSYQDKGLLSFLAVPSFNVMMEIGKEVTTFCKEQRHSLFSGPIEV